MNEATRTIIFVVVAVVSVVIAFAARQSSSVKPLDEFDESLISQPFYPDFTDPNEATSLRVVTFNEKRGEAKIFEVASKDGKWTIPSHHNYPVDGKDRLERTAASVIKIQRGALAGRRKSEFERLGVVDPMDVLEADKEIEDVVGIGNRIGLYKGETALAEFIIGNAVEGKRDHYYVRRPDEDQTFITQVEVDLSTDFVDWIEPDLLQIERAELKEIDIFKYSVNEPPSSGKVLSLSKEDEVADWKLYGLDEMTEELVETEVNSIVNVLDDMKIVGVRPKPPIFSENLRVNKGISLNRSTLADLENRGFYLGSDGQGNTALMSEEGEMQVATTEGVSYRMYFGKVFTGTEFEIEVGFANDKEKNKAEQNDNSDEEDSTEGESDDEKKSRYLFVMASFDPSAIGEPPVKPTKPEPKPEKTETKDDGNSEDDKEDKDDAGKENDEGAKDDESDNKEPDADVDEKVDPEKEYQQALEKYEADRKSYQSKVEAGQKKAKELNDRFAPWYYVISAQSFEDLSLTREALVRKKPAEEVQDSSDENNSDSKKPGLPEINPKDKENKPESNSKTESSGKKEEKPADKDDSDQADNTTEKPTTKNAEDDKASSEESAGTPKEEEKPAESGNTKQEN